MAHLAHPILSPKAGQKIILLGNEAIVRGCLESGIDFATAYPGTPSSEVPMAFHWIVNHGNAPGIYFEYSINEKVAFEAAAAAAFSGLTTITSMKHFGLNVAADALMPVAYIGVKGGFVVMVADDPHCCSSAQSEQDTRHYARMAHMPMFEPSDPQECKDFTKLAFELSRKHGMPVFLRTTTKVSHCRASLKIGKMKKGKRKGKFVKDFKRYNNLPPHTMEMHERILAKMDKIRETFSEKTPINKVINGNTKSRVGIITCSSAYSFVMEAMAILGLKLPVLKIGFTWPLPEKRISAFIRKYGSILVAEELDPLLQKEVERLAKEANPRLKIYGKNGYLPRADELDTEKLLLALSMVLNKSDPIDIKAHCRTCSALNIPKRTPVLCPGCQHRATFWSVKKTVGKDVIFGGDVGCYTLGVLPPHKMADTILCMGSGTGVSHGISKATGQDTVAFIGDSTFFHAGMPEMMNTVYNKSNPMIVILDNRWTAMTGHQPNPSTEINGMGEKTKKPDLVAIAKALGVDNTAKIDPFRIKASTEAV
ncbi:MAG: thiamine pyrophosphate-dependent enzyme, partial [Candidatus Aenigmarchaeota archaeon]